MEDKDKKKTAKKTPTKKVASKKEQPLKTTGKKKTTTSSKKTTPKKTTPKKTVSKKTTSTKKVESEKKTPVKKEEIVKTTPTKPELTEEDIKKILETEKKNNDNTETIYLTKSFKTLGKTSVFSHAIKKILLYIIVLAGLIALGYYVIYPFVVKKLIINPNDKINKIIAKIASDTEELIDAYIPGESFTITSDISISSTDEEYSYLSDYKYYLTNEMDTKNQIYHKSLLMKNDTNELTYQVIKENGETYINFDNNKKIYNITVKEDSNITKEDKITNRTNDVSKESIKNLAKDSISFIKDIIQNEKITKSKDSISINNRTLNLTKYQITISETKQKEYIKKYEKEVLNKKELLDTLSSLTNKDKEEIIDYLYQKVDGELKINIYLDKDYNFKGIDIEQNGFRTLYYYQDQDEFNIHFKNSKGNPIDIKGINKDGVIDSTIYYQNKKEAELKINKFTKEELDIYIKTSTYEFKLNKKQDSDYKLELTHATNESITRINSTIKIEDKKIESVIDDYQINDNAYDYNEARRSFIYKLNKENLDYIEDNIID